VGSNPTPAASSQQSLMGKGIAGCRRGRTSVRVRPGKSAVSRAYCRTTAARVPHELFPRLASVATGTSRFELRVAARISPGGQRRAAGAPERDRPGPPRADAAAAPRQGVSCLRGGPGARDTRLSRAETSSARRVRRGTHRIQGLSPPPFRSSTRRPGRTGPHHPGGPRVGGPPVCPLAWRLPELSRSVLTARRLP
jgi:hypothetical protein